MIWCACLWRAEGFVGVLRFSGSHPAWLLLGFALVSFTRERSRQSPWPDVQGSRWASNRDPFAPRTPRCAPDEPSQPGNAKQKLRTFKQSLSKCLLLGERPRDATAMVFLLRVAEDGTVREASIVEGSTGPQFEACANDAMRALRFEPFCGADVEFRWRIQVQ